MTRKCLTLLCSLSFLVAVNAGAQYSHIKNIVGSDHDLSNTGTGAIHASGTESEVCYFCHAPHQSLNTSDATVTTGPNTQAPLWNHYLSSVASYGVYSSTSFNNLGTDIADLGGAAAGSAAVSNLCLSCHDGTVGVNVLYHGQFGQGSPAMSCNGTNVPANSPCLVPDAVLIGNPATVTGTKSLADLHPINFTYDATLAGKTVDLITPVANTTGIGGASRMGVPGSNGTFLPLFQTASGGTFKMQCATCHDAHNGVPGDRPFLRDTTTGSKLCLDCHGN